MKSEKLPRNWCKSARTSEQKAEQNVWQVSPSDLTSQPDWQNRSVLGVSEIAAEPGFRQCDQIVTQSIAILPPYGILAPQSWWKVDTLCGSYKPLLLAIHRLRQIWRLVTRPGQPQVSPSSVLSLYQYSSWSRTSKSLREANCHVNQRHSRASRMVYSIRARCEAAQVNYSHVALASYDSRIVSLSDTSL